MNPSDRSLAYKDALFISPHKFPGGPGTPGVLAAKRNLFCNNVPATPGGGTVKYVDHLHRFYLDDLPDREEGGTPDILGSIRAGLVSSLREDIGAETIHTRGQEISSRIINAWKDDSNIVVLGNCTCERLPIVSFVVQYNNKALHHNFVTSLLSDLFGIQARGGTSCASPYAQRLLGISNEDSERISECVQLGETGIRPGWCRVSLAYYETDAVVDYLIEAVKLIARYGWRAVPDYDFSVQKGHWRHSLGKSPLLSLKEVKPTSCTYLPEEVLAKQLEDGLTILQGNHNTTVSQLERSENFESLRWFWLPEELVTY
jgi:selenocysteine lyase/cysteine desulfurase